MSNHGSFKNLLVWAKAHKLVLMVYQATRSFPKEELYGLTAQLRRASISVPANIAEGYKRKGHLEKIRFYNIAQASLEEVKYFLILSRDLELKVPDEANELAEEISKMLEAYIQRMKESKVNEPSSEY